MTYVVVRSEQGFFVVGEVLAYDDVAGTLSYEFKGATYTAPLSQVRRVRHSLTEIAMSSNQDEAAERVRAALLEFRQNRATAIAGPAKPPRSRYATFGVDSPPAPSPAKVTPGVKRAPVAAPSPKIETRLVERPAVRLYNARVEMFFAPDTKIKAKLPNGKIEHCFTAKDFGKAYKLS